MFPDITCRGFELRPPQAAKLRRDIWTLLEMCPSDSIIETELEKKGERIEMTLSVTYLGGQFISRSEGANLDESVRHGLNKLYDQIRFWRDGRFVGASWIGSLAEYASEAVLLRGVPLKAPRILIVEDEIGTAQILERCLERHSVQTDVAHSGKDAIEKIMSSPFDLIIMDWTLPDMTGGEALAKVERLNSIVPSNDFQWEARRLPIITYSGRERSEIRLPDSRHFRFIDHWPKSGTFSQLVHRTDEVVGRLRHEMEAL